MLPLRQVWPGQQEVTQGFAKKWPPCPNPTPHLDSILRLFWHIFFLLVYLLTADQAPTYFHQTNENCVIKYLVLHCTSDREKRCFRKFTPVWARLLAKWAQLSWHGLWGQNEKGTLARRPLAVVTLSWQRSCFVKATSLEPLWSLRIVSSPCWSCKI